MTKHQNLLVAFDGSENGLKALETAKELVKDNHKQLTVVYVHGSQSREPIYTSTTPDGDQFMMHHVVGPDAINNYSDPEVKIIVEEMPNRVMAAAKSKLTGVKGVTYEKLSGKPADAIVKHAANNNIDLIIIGQRGIGAIKKLVAGSVSQKVIDNAECSVLLVK